MGSKSNDFLILQAIIDNLK